MKIDFEITNFPVGEQKKYLITYLEGSLKIYVGNVLFFNQQEIPLIEFAIFVDKWSNDVKNDIITNFIYNSMDHDEPILSIIYIKDGHYRIDSIWKEAEINELISEKEIIAEFKKYLENLNDAIKLRFNIGLKDIIR